MASNASGRAPRVARTEVLQKAGSDQRNYGAPVAPASRGLTGRSYLVFVGVLVAGGGWLVWRRRQRQLALAVSAVSVPTIPEPVAAAPAPRFSVDFLNRLEWKRFEELVAAYYGKTGVVAARTGDGPAGPVHIRISWKGEQRPFASVHCIAQPDGPVGDRPVRLLGEALAADGMRRGYVVTSGAFDDAARTLADAQHITLLPGDLLLEKLNALPDGARAELMKDASTGDYSTPTCSRCDTKMARALGTPWSCPQCGTSLPN